MLGAPPAIGKVLLVAAGVVWLTVAALHGVRPLRHPEALAADLRHPVLSAFAGAATIGRMILAGGLIPHAPELAAPPWLLAVAGHLVIAAWTIRGLLLAPREAASPAPPLLIPLVGNVLAPVFGARLGFEGMAWRLFWVGALLWVILRPILLARLVTGPACRRGCARRSSSWWRRPRSPRSRRRH